MKNIYVAFIVCLEVFVAFHTKAARFEEAVFSGNGCAKEIGKKVKLGPEQHFKIPLHLELIKTEASRIERRLCSFAMTVKLGKNERLRISDVSQSLKLKMTDAAHVKISLSVMTVGKTVKPLEYEVKTATDGIQVLKQDGIFLETSCGIDAILRGSISAFADGEAEVKLKTSDLNVNVKVENCH